MKDEKQTRDVINEVLSEEGLKSFKKVFEKEHNPFRGTHERPLIQIKATVQNDEPAEPHSGQIWVDTSEE